MAANFWLSSHYKEWLFPKEKLEAAHARDKKEIPLTTEEITFLTIYFTQQIQTLGKRLGLRQRVIATALVYFRRFYTKHNFLEFCPRLIATTCLYIATKVEECTTSNPAYRFEQTMKKLDWKYTVHNLLECEFYVLEALSFNLIVYHPYRPLLDFFEDFKSQCNAPEELLRVAWSFINDSYFTDLSLEYPPHVVALGCLYLATHIKNEDLRPWFADLNIDMKDIWATINELLEFYEVWQKPRPEGLLSKLPKFPHYNSK